MRELLRNPVVHWCLAGLCLALAIAGSWELTPSRGLNQLLGNTAPEFLGAAIISLIVSSHLKNDQRRAYVNAIRAVRAEFAARSQEGEQDPEPVQQSMVSVVRAISSLHFGSPQPPNGQYSHLNRVRAQCETCKSRDEKIDGGRCERCKDIVESWTDAEQYPAR